MQLKRFADMQKKKIFFACWRSTVREENTLCMQNLIWTEADMDHFLHTVASFETHKRHWKERREEQAVRGHEHGKQMPRLIPPSYVHLFQLTLSQTHCAKFQQHFGAATLDGTLHTPFQLLAEQEVFQLRLFTGGLVAAMAACHGPMQAAGAAADLREAPAAATAEAASASAAGYADSESDGCPECNGVFDPNENPPKRCSTCGECYTSVSGRALPNWKRVADSCFIQAKRMQAKRIQAKRNWFVLVELARLGVLVYLAEDSEYRWPTKRRG